MIANDSTMNARIDNNTPTHMLPPGNMNSGHWHGRLALDFSMRNGATRLVRKEHFGPLYVQKPFYPEGRDLAHVYLLHPPGGLVSGDRLEISVELDQSARVQMTTPGAGKVYRARQAGAVQEQVNLLRVGAGSMLEWFPQECIVFDSADARLSTEVHLEPSSTFSGWELVSLGLPASKQAFTRGSIGQKLEILESGRPVLVETLRIDQDDAAFLQSGVGLQGCPVTGLFIAGPFRNPGSTPELLKQLRELSDEYKPIDSVRSRCHTAVTLVNDFILCRYLGTCSWQARQFFMAAWSRTRPVLNSRPVCAPRIWST